MLWYTAFFTQSSSSLLSPELALPGALGAVCGGRDGCGGWMGMKLGDLCDVLIACAGHFTFSESQQWQFLSPFSFCRVNECEPSQETFTHAHTRFIPAMNVLQSRDKFGICAACSPTASQCNAPLSPPPFKFCCHCKQEKAKGQRFPKPHTRVWEGNLYSLFDFFRCVQEVVLSRRA